MKSIHKTVNDLVAEEFAELKETYFWQLQETDIEKFNRISFSDDVPNSEIINYYDGVEFVNDDFFCNMI